ncbi:SDR family oxidoreductase [Acrocarpospora catenulata]|uniref:SDR family oxidoreductase n=1 Tax=Acrocarpospora catenulata TaxID=2836182 RepID=UPI001BDA6F1B|nr:SDR family oxidoreductase [Acrocarpospora catenulata]
MRIYLTGADGLLGTAVTAALAAEPETAHWPVLGVSVGDFDIADGTAVRRSIDAFAPDVVLHAAGLAVVDACESDPRLAMRVNVEGTSHVAEACARLDARLVYISSDYVFDGRRGGYRESDAPNPVSVYGLTKLAGERLAALVPSHLVVRTSWLYGGACDQVAELTAALRAGERPALIDDQFSGPTHVDELARALVWLLRHPYTGTIHAANGGRASWYDVGREVARHLGGEVTRAGLADFGFVGERPRDSHLRMDRIASLGHPMAHWTEALARFCARLPALGV